MHARKDSKAFWKNTQFFYRKTKNKEKLTDDLNGHKHDILKILLALHLAIYL